MVSTYAKISRASILGLIGFQENYKEIVTVPDFKKSDCCDCFYNPKNSLYDNSDISQCMACKKAKTVYVNERNHYGQTSTINKHYNTMLKAGAIRLFLALHFCEINTDTGCTAGTDISDLAALLSCDKKTILNNLNILSTYNYIDYLQLDTKHVYATITNYKNIFKKAKAGGRGYILMSQDVLQQFLAYKKINDLRLSLRFLHEATLNQEQTGPKKARVNITFSQLRRYLPKYVKPYIIRNTLTHIDSFFIDYMQVNDRIRFTLKDELLSSVQHKQLLSQNYLEINNYIKSVSDALEAFNLTLDPTDIPLESCGIHAPFTYLDADFNLKYEVYKPFYFNSVDRKDLARLSTEYSLDEVLKALSELYNSYPGGLHELRSVGASVRELIRDNRAYFNILKTA